MKIQSYLFVGMISLFFIDQVFGTDYTISGTVTGNLQGDPPLENVTMTASNGGGTTQTMADGSYGFTLPSGWSGTITPSKPDYQFHPENRSYSNLAGDSTDQDFTGTYIFKVSGYVRTLEGPCLSFDQPDDFTNPISGARVYWGYNFLDTVYTDADGYYYFRVPQDVYGEGSVGSIELDLDGNGDRVSPLKIDLYYITENADSQNFHVYMVIEGSVEDSSGNFIDGVTITAVSDGGITATGITGEGYWIIQYGFALNYRFSGTITPSKPGWGFTPEMYACTNLVDKVNPVFIGEQLSDLYCDPASLVISPTTVEVGNSLNISGVIENQGAGSSGVGFQVNLYICAYPDVLEFGSSYFLGSFIVSTLDSGLTSSFNETVTVPLSATPGTYYAWVSIDPPDAVTESDETNNQQSCSTPLVVNATVIAPENAPIITHFELRQNVPNPFNPVTRIQYQLPQTSHVNLGIYNLMGQELVCLVDEVKDTGVYSVEWDGKDSQGAYLPSGIYIYQIKAGEFTESKKLILSR